jgi:alpha-L-arabinofuranosidase
MCVRDCGSKEIVVCGVVASNHRAGLRALMGWSFLLATASSLAQGVPGPSTPWVAPLEHEVKTEISGPVSVDVDTSRVGNFMAPRALGVQASIYDQDLLQPATPEMLKAAGVLTLRYPGGSATDQVHWSVNNKYDGRHPVDFGSFVKLVDRLGGTMVLAVNYGANLKNDGPGEPAEAAAWVAYANGKRDDPKVIGKDSAGNEWKTVGYWAEMRSSAPLADDDGYNFLRLSHPQQLNVKYWEVGNAIYTNGYTARDQGDAENDLHVPYSADTKKNAALRNKNARLGPAAYGEGVSQFAKAMKSVDSRISVGAALDLTTADSDWNSAVLKACAADIDFVSLHWYPGNYAPPDWKNLDDQDFLASPTVELPKIVAALIDQVKEAAGGKTVQLAVTEVNVRPFVNVTDPVVAGLFAADAYASLAQDGAVNIDWAGLHSDDFVKSGDNQPRAAYYGVAMVHKFVNMRDTFVAAKSSTTLLTVHAAKRADGTLGLMFVNKDPKNIATVRVKVDGGSLANAGTRYDWGSHNAAVGVNVQQSTAGPLGNSFTIKVPAYSVTDLIIPLAK